ncbi:hypothetical protein [Streptomyces erythrochromogenes]|uniref:hypothetical protein n=1 Tax=Streptomyces erythrochromogenes TaxID=285574 RepID=UPI00381D3F3C
MNYRARGGSGHLAELVFGTGQADPEPFGFSEPALALRLLDPGDQVVADVGQS